MSGYGPGGYGGPPAGGHGGGYGPPSGPYEPPASSHVPPAPRVATFDDGQSSRPRRRVSPGVVLAINLSAIGGIALARTGSAMDAFALSMLGSAIGGVSVLGFFALLAAMLVDLKSFTRDPQFHWWFVLLPFYNVYWLMTVVRAQVSKARETAGLPRQTRSGVLYLLLPAWALAADMDDFSDR